jgi:hypothetical protein
MVPYRDRLPCTPPPWPRRRRRAGRGTSTRVFYEYGGIVSRNPCPRRDHPLKAFIYGPGPSRKPDSALRRLMGVRVPVDVGGCPSASSGDLPGNGQMLVMRTIEGSANSVGEFVSPQQTVGLDYFALAVNPFRLDGIEPRTLRLGKRQLTTLTPSPLFLTRRLCLPR